jgi:hypothetical protein
MSKALTEIDREDKRDFDFAFQARLSLLRLSHFPSYFDNFRVFEPSLALSMGAMLMRRRFRRECEIPPTAAIMAIV